MALDLTKLRRLVALDPADPLSRFALGKKLFESAVEQEPPAMELLEESAGHLIFANGWSPAHLATYHILGQVLTAMGRTEEARRVFQEGIARVEAVGGGMGHDLGPAMQALLERVS